MSYYSALCKECCDEGSLHCFQPICGNNGAVTDNIEALAIIKGDLTIPKPGDTIQVVSGCNTIFANLTEANYAVKLLEWVRCNQINCGSDATITFFNAGVLQKGMRARPTREYDEETSARSRPEYNGYTTTSTFYFGKHYASNSDFFCDLLQTTENVSVIYFYKDAVQVIESSGDSRIYVSDAGYEVTGNIKQKIKGDIVFTEEGICDPKFYHVCEPDFLSSLKKKTEIVVELGAVTGLTAVTCGTKKGCSSYTVAPSTPFSITLTTPTLTSCADWVLYKDCYDEIPVAEPILIDSTLGTITSTGLPAGEYKYTAKVKNCCVDGDFCFVVKVA